MTKICAINMYLFNCDAEIYCGNSLAVNYDFVYVIKSGGYVHEFENKREKEPIVKKKKRMEIQI